MLSPDEENVNRRLLVHGKAVPMLLVGTHFQFRSFGHESLSAIGVIMPPLPGEGEAIIVTGEWQPTET